MTVLNLARRIARRGRVALGIAALLGLGVASVTVAGCGSGDPGVRPTTASRDFPLSDLQRDTITLPGGQQMMVYVMDTDAKRGEGMMYVQDAEFPIDRGMIFVYPDEQLRRFNAKNVWFVLDLTFIAADGTVLEQKQMLPFVEKPPVASDVRAKYVLETRGGRIYDFGVRPGMKITIPDTIAAKE